MPALLKINGRTRLLGGTLILALSLSAGCWESARASTNEAFDEGLWLYKGGQYNQAIVRLTRASITQPSDPVIHYYLADSYARLGKHAQAKQEYFACYCLDPNGATGAYCKEALKAYGEPVPGDIGSAQSAGTAVKSAPDDNAKHVTQAVSQMHAQAERQKESNNAIAKQGSLTAGRIGAEEANRITSAAYRRASMQSPLMVPNDFFIRDGYTYDPAGYMARAEESARLARLAAKEKADAYENWSHDQAKAVDEVVKNLESQLKGDKMQSGARLRPEGTGLYVRYYGKERNSPLPDVHGSVARIAPFGTDQSEPVEEHIPARKSVRGTVIGK